MAELRLCGLVGPVHRKRTTAGIISRKLIHRWHAASGSLFRLINEISERERKQRWEAAVVGVGRHKNEKSAVKSEIGVNETVP